MEHLWLGSDAILVDSLGHDVLGYGLSLGYVSHPDDYLSPSFLKRSGSLHSDASRAASDENGFATEFPNGITVIKDMHTLGTLVPGTFGILVKVCVGLILVLWSWHLTETIHSPRRGE